MKKTPSQSHSRSARLLGQCAATVFVLLILCFYSYTPMCVSTVYSVLIVLWKKITSILLNMGYEPTTFISRTASYQLDHWDCPVARGSTNPML